ncbi:chloride channel protein 2-like isoform X1 [Panulirus ornatus]|uniref:chloride channel protein 2-like isoform X1 n=1 Tax=Panulirus ornatus TaxID=150431 RepID=UPI003A895069
MAVEKYAEDSCVGGPREAGEGYTSDVQETPIILPLLHAATGLQNSIKNSSDVVSHTGDFAEPYFKSSSSSLVPESSLPAERLTPYPRQEGDCHSSVSERPRWSCRQAGARVSVPRRRLGTVTPPFPEQMGGGRLSVSFGDVTVCDRLGIQERRPTRRQSLPASWCSKPQPTVFDIPNIDDIILAGASPVLDKEPQKRPNRRSFIEYVGSLPEWLASKQLFSSVSSVALPKTTMQDTVMTPDLKLATLGSNTERQELSQMLEQVRQGYLTSRKAELRVAGKVRFRVLRPSVSMGAFGDWKDVENASLTMYGRYTKDLGRYARQEAKKLKKAEKVTLDSGTSGLRPYRGKVSSKCLRVLGAVWRATFARVGEDWVFLAVLGVVMAIISFIMDYGIAMCNKARIWLYRDLASHTALQYLAWVSLPVCLILFSAGFVHILAPQAVGSGIPEIIALLKGSGIPEMKTILRGVVLKEYLTFKTLIAKVIGLTATLGSGLPLGKEGPFVHIASIVATLLSKAVTSFKGIYENESRNSEMLAAACAVGVACSFAAPIGGVLFSIEVTSVYFAVRNYWRGFFAAVCGAMVFRLLAVWFNDEETLTALFKTNFKVGYPFDPQELFVFALIGVMCGFLGAFFVWVHRQYVIFMRRNKKMKTFLQKSRLLYPLFVTIIYGSLSFPLGSGQFWGTDLSNHQQVVELFSNITWTKEEHTVHEFEVVENWRTPWTGIFVNLILYITFTFCGSVVASTLPVPSGIFIPVFKIGAALGRIMGEAMACTFPSGLRYGGHNHIIIPGGYSIVGAAALAGAVTHTISTSVIVFELTGQITHILPVMIAVLIANGIAQLLQPSVYDSIIQIKKLPYLPDILTATSGAYNIYVEDFMVRDVKYIWYGITYRHLKNILKENKKIRSLPLVDSPDSMILLGSIQRSELISMLEEHLGKDRRLKVINKWKNAAQKLPVVRRRNTLCGALEAEQLQKETEEKQREEERRKTKQRLLDIAEERKRKASPLPSAGLAIVAGVGGVMTAVAGFGLTFQDEKNSLLITAASSAATTSMVPTSTVSSITTTVSTPSIVTPPTIIPTTSMAEDFGNKGRRPSRFEVTKVETPSKQNESSVTLQIDPVEIPMASEPALDKILAPQRNTLPRKSILKKTNSFILHPASSSPFASPQHTPYATVHAGDSKLRQAFEAVLRKTSLRRMDDKNGHSSQNINMGSTKRVSLPMERIVEMTLEEQRRWEEEELNKEVDFSKCHIDPAPFQLVERTSLLKVHSLFSMLGLNHAYVTAIGRIIGVVALKELRKAVESTNSGDFSKPKKDRGVGGTFREKFLRPTIRRKLRKAIEETNSGDFPKADTAPAAPTTGGSCVDSPSRTSKTAEAKD